MTPRMKVAIDERMSGEELLGLERRLASRPRSMASQTLSMAAHGAAAPRGAVRAPVR